jgi:hypothetical protein
MPYYAAPYTFDFEQSLVLVDPGVTDVDCISLYNAAKAAQASEEGIVYGQIAAGSGLVELGQGVQVGITVELLGNWQIFFPAGNYIARVAGGNLVGGPSSDPIAYSAGVQTLLIQSAASTVVQINAVGIPVDASDIAAAVCNRDLSGHNAPGSLGKAIKTIQQLARLIPGLF